METISSISTVSHVIQLAVAPVFLLSGVGAILAVLINRLGRIVDRYRLLERSSPNSGANETTLAQIEMEILARRARLIHWAISLCTVGALFICIVHYMAYLSLPMGYTYHHTLPILFCTYEAI